jgi:hypothetical protein
VLSLLRWKSNKSHIFWVCVYSLSYPERRALESIILSSVACSGLSYSCTLSHKRHGFREKVFEYKICVLILSTHIVWDISHSKNNWDRYNQKVYFSSCKVLVILAIFEWNLNFLDRFSKNKESNLNNIRPVRAVFFNMDGWVDGRTDRWTDRYDEASSRFLQFCKRT